MSAHVHCRGMKTHKAGTSGRGRGMQGTRDTLKQAVKPGRSRGRGRGSNQQRQDSILVPSTPRVMGRGRGRRRRGQQRSGGEAGVAEQLQESNTSMEIFSPSQVRRKNCVRRLHLILFL